MSRARLYVIVRMDMIPGLQAAQASHAAQEFVFDHPETARSWRDTSNTIALLGATDETHLCELRERAVDAGLKVSAFHDDDLETPFTALAIEPALRAKSLCRGLPLLLAA